MDACTSFVRSECSEHSECSECPDARNGGTRRGPIRGCAAAHRITAQGRPTCTADPGYASPAWHDVDGDGRFDLVVGQFLLGKL